VCVCVRLTLPSFDRFASEGLLLGDKRRGGRGRERKGEVRCGGRGRKRGREKVEKARSTDWREGERWRRSWRGDWREGEEEDHKMKAISRRCACDEGSA
jgi:hypothetical protein